MIFFSFAFFLSSKSIMFENTRKRKYGTVAFFPWILDGSCRARLKCVVFVVVVVVVVVIVVIVIVISKRQITTIAAAAIAAIAAAAAAA